MGLALGGGEATTEHMNTLGSQKCGSGVAKALGIQWLTFLGELGAFGS